MPNLLNLRKDPPIKIVEKLIPEKRVWWLEILKMVTIVTVTVSVVYGISHADVVLDSKTPDLTQSFTGIYGVVTSMSGDTLSLDDSQGSRYEGIDVFNVDLKSVNDIETNDDVPSKLSIADIKAGDKIIARGIIDGDKLAAYQIISFSYIAPLVASSTISTTTDVTSVSASITPDASVVVPDNTVQLATSTATSTITDASSTEVIPADVTVTDPSVTE